MDCWTCRQAAVGCCRFCGRGTCTDHAQTRAYILELFTSGGRQKGLVVPDALWCGVCSPRPDPIDLPDLS